MIFWLIVVERWISSERSILRGLFTSSIDLFDSHKRIHLRASPTMNAYCKCPCLMKIKNSKLCYRRLRWFIDRQISSTYSTIKWILLNRDFFLCLFMLNEKIRIELMSDLLQSSTISFFFLFFLDEFINFALANFDVFQSLEQCVQMILVTLSRLKCVSMHEVDWCLTFFLSHSFLVRHSNK